MHQLIQEMGREVVRQEAVDQPGRRSRLRGHKDTCNVLRTKKGKSAVKGLHFQFSGSSILISSKNHHSKHTSTRVCQPCIDPTHSPGETPKWRPIGTDAFKKMDNLNLLELNYVTLEGSYAKFPKALKWLCWRGFHLESIPEDFDLYELVVLDMQNSSLVHAWEGRKYLGALKIINLNYSDRLVDTPDLSCATGIEAISLEDCTGLVEVHESLGSLSKLKYLNLKGCRNLKKFPRNMHNLVSLETLDLSGCSSLFTDSNPMDTSTITDALINPELLSQFRVPVPPAISFSSLPSLVKLTLSNCGISGDDLFSYLSCSSSLEFLDLTGNPITAIDKNLGPFTRLSRIVLRECKNLRSVSILPGTCSMDVSHCRSLEKVAYSQNPFLLSNDSTGKPKSSAIGAFDCPKLVEIGGVWNFETTSDMAPSRANYLGYPNLESFGDKDLRFDFNASYAMSKGVYQIGMYSVFLVGDHIDKWFHAVAYDSELRYTVPLLPNRSIRGFNVCCVYNAKAYLPFNRVSRITAELSIKNESSMWAWSYESATYAVVVERDVHVVPVYFEEEPGGMWSPTKVGLTWISHWCVMDHRELKPGDVLNISIPSTGDNDALKCGIKIVYEDDEDEVMNEVESGSRIDSVADWYNDTFRSVDLSVFESSAGSRKYELVCDADLESSLHWFKFSNKLQSVARGSYDPSYFYPPSEDV
uniref:Uncharacterized protein n=1 Tax=Kalanchoe fedtschenkoi TaxID=63787 RepID=A0A7N0RG99_KALFE